MPHPRYTSDEIVQRGEALYSEIIRSSVETVHKGKFLVLDIETGEYEIGEDHLSAADRALNKHAGAALYALRIGHPTAIRIGRRLDLPRP